MLTSSTLSPRILFLGAAIALFATVSTLSRAEPISFSSGEQRTALLELYTSQGCYSCPPAENWLNRLTDHPQLWTNVVPVALHVDYWDYLGWKDPFADRRNQERHYAYKFQGLTRGIYTPEMILNGRDWGGWKRQRSVTFNKSKAAADKVGTLELTLDRSLVDAGEKPLQVFFTAAKKDKRKLRATVALVGFDIAMQIDAGENKGKKLAHEFVVLAQHSAIAAPESAMYQWRFDELDFPQREALKVGRVALVSWVNAADDNTPLQATGGWLVEPPAAVLSQVDTGVAQ